MNENNGPSAKLKALGLKAEVANKAAVVISERLEFVCGHGHDDHFAHFESDLFDLIDKHYGAKILAGYHKK